MSNDENLSREELASLLKRSTKRVRRRGSRTHGSGTKLKMKNKRGGSPTCSCSDTKQSFDCEFKQRRSNSRSLTSRRSFGQNSLTAFLPNKRHEKSCATSCRAVRNACANGRSLERRNHCHEVIGADFDLPDESDLNY